MCDNPDPVFNGKQKNLFWFLVTMLCESARVDILRRIFINKVFNCIFDPTKFMVIISPKLLSRREKSSIRKKKDNCFQHMANIKK